MNIQDVPAKFQDLTMKRIQAAKRDGFLAKEAHVCPETGCGTLIGIDRWADKDQLKARHYRAGSFKTSFQREDIKSNHQRLQMAHGKRVKTLLQAKKDAKKQPHDLKIGDIIARIWGVTMQGVEFFKVVDIPGPRKVAMIPLASRQVSGDWMGGTVEPIDVPVEELEGEGFVYDVDMSSGEARIKGNSIERIGRWSGKPVSVYSD